MDGAFFASLAQPPTVSLVSSPPKTRLRMIVCSCIWQCVSVQPDQRGPAADQQGACCPDLRCIILPVWMRPPFIINQTHLFYNEDRSTYRQPRGSPRLHAALDGRCLRNQVSLVSLAHQVRMLCCLPPIKSQHFHALYYPQHSLICSFSASCKRSFILKCAKALRQRAIHRLS